MNRRYEGVIEVEVADRTVVARDTLALTLRTVDDLPWPEHTAGAHVDVHLPNGILRQYSLLAPSDGSVSTAQIAVLKTDDSRGGSRSIHEGIRPGHRILVSEPKNNFVLESDDTHVMLIGGGIGITPLLAMARELAAAGRSFEVHYRVRNLDRAAFVRELTELTAPGALHVGSDPSEFVPEAVLAEAGLDSAIYVCGPEAFMEFVKTGAEVAGLPAAAVHEEHFKHDAHTSGHAFQLTAASSNVTIEVGEHDTIAKALSAAGVFVPTSCEQGVCGTCVARVLDGVPDHRDVYLSAAEKQQGRAITLCCSRASTDSLTVDV